MVYKWKYGMNGIQAQKAGEYFESVEKRDGKIQPKVIVNEARPEDALLHPAFEWDDTSAAEKYREYQAGHIIRSLVVVQEQANKESVITRAIVSVAPVEAEEKPQYVSISTAMSNDDMRESLFNSALAELQSFKAKYKGLSELSLLFKEIDRLAK